ncbi:hypothetical protein [Methylobacterium sp.]
MGSVREVISCLLGKWADQGLIEVRSGEVHITDHPGLAAKRPN